MRTIVPALVFTFISICTADKEYNASNLHDRYPDYGDSWMFFPDGDGRPRIALLQMPAESGERAGRVEDLVTFTLYTRNKPEGEQIFLDVGSLRNSTYDENKETKIITHGWMSSGSSNTCQDIKNAYLDDADYNVFVYDWEPLANNVVYPLVQLKVGSVGTELAKYVEMLIMSGTDRTKIHIIGHSLGAHIAGTAGSKLQEDRVGRITGLDPAGPFFSSDRADRLSNRSADFVDVIHTAGWVVGYGDSIGTADFYPNGGMPPQPGCYGLTEIVEGCSHSKSWKFFRNSIDNKEEYRAKRCASYRDFKNDKCDDMVVYMGEPTRTDVSGNFYLTTNSVD